MKCEVCNGKGEVGIESLTLSEQLKRVKRMRGHTVRDIQARTGASSPSVVDTWLHGGGVSQKYHAAVREYITNG